MPTTPEEVSAKLERGETPTPQEVFEAVAVHDYRQGRPAMMPDANGVMCMYRAPDGCRCNAGCLIPDSKYNPGMEGVKITGVKFQQYFAFPWEIESLVEALQRCHDWAPPGIVKWRLYVAERLVEIAKIHHLNDDFLADLYFPPLR